MSCADSRPEMPDAASGDTLPEYQDYRDEGCALFPSCLLCPLPRCRYDEQAEGKRTKRKLRDGDVMRLRRETGKGTAELARIFGVSTRTVQRIIRRNNDDGNNRHS